MEKKTILVVIPVNTQHKVLLEEAAPECRFIYSSIEEVTEEQVQEADVIMGNVSPAMLEKAEKLQWLQLNSAGADAYGVPGLFKENTIVTTANGAYGKTVAEHMFAMLLAMQKKLPLYRDSQSRHSWDDYGTVTSIADATVLVFGMGDIGRYFSKMAHALGAYVIGVKRTPGNCPEYVDEPHLMKECKELLPHADVIFSVLPSTKETRGLFDKEMFRLMKKDAIFLNAGRGDAVCTDDLCEILDEGRLAGVALDVMDPEPLPADHRLWDYPNVFITPHVSGYYHLPETLDKVVNICVENLKSFVKGQKLKNRMNFEAGYCTENKKK
ncbi:MAG: D-2-hydroxyacid dehydrogenase [Blautia sp.]